MLNFILQLSFVGLTGRTTALPEIPPGPSLDRVRGPVAVPLLEAWQSMLIVLLILIVAGLLGWRFLQYFRGQKNQHRTTSPHETAIAELKSAAELTADDNERFAVLSSLALRRYFETGKGMHALGKTTDEFLKSMRTHSMLNAEARKSLAECLQRCDQVKFAREPLNQADRRKLTENALAVIRQCEATQSETDVQHVQP